MKAKRFLAFAMALIIGFSLNAESLDAIISSAKENSPQFSNTKIAYQDGLLSLKQLEQDDETIITISGSANPYYETSQRSETGSGSSDKIKAFSVSPRVDVTSSDGNTTIGTTMGYAMSYDGKFNSLTPGISASHIFDLSGYDSDSLDNLNYTISSLNTEVTFANGEYTFEKTVLSTISTLLNALKSLDAINKSISDLQTSLDNLDKLGTVSTDSITYKNAVNSLNVAKNSKIALEKQYEDAKANYKVFTGLDWDGVDSFPEPVLDLRIIDGGNSTVILKSLALEQAQLEYNNLKATQNPVGFKIDGSVSGSYISSDPDIKTGSLALNAGIAYSANNWTVSASHKSSWGFEKNSSTSYSPSITLSGAWTNGSISSSSGKSVQSTRDELELQIKQNAISKANNEYISALTSYTQEGQSLYVRIMQWNFDKSEANNNLEYLKSVLESKKSLFDNGLATQSDVDNAQFDLDQAEYDWQIMMLDGLSLERDLRIFAL